jgi:chemotaxis protein MotB
MEKPRRPIIVKKVKKGGHAHHGGSWKVAYADFVTAMMAFFMVMWILGMDEQTRKAIEGYFSSPAGVKKGYGSGSSPLSSGNSPTKLADRQIRMIVRAAEERAFKQTAESIRAKLDSAKGFIGNARFEVSTSQQGLRIELIEDASGENFFPRGSAQLKPAAVDGLAIVAHELLALHNSIVVEGHTDASAYGSSATYTNWELSSDRANAARRALEHAGLPRGRITEVRGYAATKLNRPDDPLASQNRRISVLLPFTEPVPPNEGPAGIASPVTARLRVSP